MCGVTPVRVTSSSIDIHTFIHPFIRIIQPLSSLITRFRDSEAPRSTYIRFLSHNSVAPNFTNLFLDVEHYVILSKTQQCKSRAVYTVLNAAIAQSCPTDVFLDQTKALHTAGAGQ